MDKFKVKKLLSTIETSNYFLFSCEVESLDKEIQKLHESYAISLQSKLLAEGNGEKVVQVSLLTPMTQPFLSLFRQILD